MENRIPLDVLIGILKKNSSTLSMWDFKGTNAFFEFLKNITHADIVDGDGVEVQFGERLHHGEQTVVLVHLVDLLVKI